jgi:hypothetical protein
MPCAEQDVYLTLGGPGFPLLADSASLGSGRSLDSPPLARSRGNNWQVLGIWDGLAPLTDCTLSGLGDTYVWLGLRNSDDQGTRFDVKAELFRSGELVASGIAYCVSGVTRNPLKARPVAVPFEPFDPVSLIPAENLSLALSVRIGTLPGKVCPGHASATGLRLYYDGPTTASSFEATLQAPD